MCQMYNTKMNQNRTKDKIISGSSLKKNIYIGIVCSHFDFTCQSVTSNTEPSGKKKKRKSSTPQSILVFLCSPPTNSFHYILHWTDALQCTTPSKSKWKTKVKSSPFNGCELQLCLWKLSIFFHLTVLSAFCRPPSHPKAVVPVPEVLHYYSLSCSLLWDKERLIIHSKFVCKRESVRRCFDSSYMKYATFWFE